MTSSPPSNGPWLEAEWVKLTTSFALHVPLATMCSGSDPPVWKWSKLPPPCALLAVEAAVALDDHPIRRTRDRVEDQEVVARLAVRSGSMVALSGPIAAGRAACQEKQRQQADGEHQDSQWCKSLSFRLSSSSLSGA
jgi:hypothetical protein